MNCKNTPKKSYYSILYITFRKIAVFVPKQVTYFVWSGDFLSASA
ncbi:hypothetical protein PPHE_a1592 [Pseudoalteromonas phenolica O-BC30]|nr:hypothetical protein [Pseudoalteromonas phenolica O-BC30]